jgi:xanthine phosphoribosyltransferase
MKYYSYENFKNDTNKLISLVKDYDANAIIGIARGGLSLAHGMAEGLDIRNVQTLRTELYDKGQKRECITLYGSCEFNEIKRVLVVDDIADSGETLDVVMKSLICGNSNIEFKSATLFYKHTSIYEPDFWLNEADDWIDFFWERDFSIS